MEETHTCDRCRIFALMHAYRDRECTRHTGVRCLAAEVRNRIIRRAWEAGFPVGTIAQEMDLSRTTVRKMVAIYRRQAAEGQELAS